MTYDAWLAGGARVRLPGVGHTVFTRWDGPVDGPVVTLLHGFPTSSHDWSPVLGDLTGAGLRVLSLDFLGYGDSDKPRGHGYRLVEQADVVEELWDLLGVQRRSLLVAHDYGVSVAQELLARPNELARVAWLNGGLYPDLHRPTALQTALVGPDGPALAPQITGEMFAAGLRAVLGRELPDTLLDDLWAGASRRDGMHAWPGLLAYMAERRENEQRWVGALEAFAGDALFVWGPEDPVSGGHVVGRLRERLPRARVEVLEGVGHWPQLEAPELVGPLLAAFLAAA